MEGQGLIRPMEWGVSTVRPQPLLVAVGSVVMQCASWGEAIDERVA